MERQDLVRIANVRAIADGLALTCEVDGRRVSVPHGDVSSGSAVRKPGDFGVLVVPRTVAHRLGLAPLRRG
jgi:hypothetical protein